MVQLIAEVIAAVALTDRAAQESGGSGDGRGSGGGVVAMVLRIIERGGVGGH